MHFDFPNSTQSPIPTHKEYPCLSLDWIGHRCIYNIQWVTHHRLPELYTETVSIQDFAQDQSLITLHAYAASMHIPFHTPLKLCAHPIAKCHLQADALKLDIHKAYITADNMIQNEPLTISDNLYKDITDMKHKSYFKVFITKQFISLEFYLAVDYLDIRANKKQNAYQSFTLCTYPLNSKDINAILNTQNELTEVAYDIIYTNKLNIDTITQECISTE